VVDSSVEGFLTAMDISCHSFVRMTNLMEPLMIDGGVLVTMSYYGADKGHCELQPNGAGQGSPPGRRALPGLRAWPKGDPRPCRLAGSAQNTGGFRPCPLRRGRVLEHEVRLGQQLIDILDIGAATAFLCSPFAKLITGGTIYVDGGYNIRG
jgi:enoyl-[acyl-carrier protein] reductase I